MQKEPEISYDDAWRVIMRDYNDDVRGICEELTRAVRDGEIEDEESFWELLDSECDGHQRVIYKHSARVALACSENPDAYSEEMGEQAPTVEAQMYMALRADCMARIGSYSDVVDAIGDENQESEES